MLDCNNCVHDPFRITPQRVDAGSVSTSREQLRDLDHCSQDTCLATCIRLGMGLRLSTIKWVFKLAQPGMSQKLMGGLHGKCIIGAWCYPHQQAADTLLAWPCPEHMG